MVVMPPLFFWQNTEKNTETAPCRQMVKHSKCCGLFNNFGGASVLVIKRGLDTAIFLCVFFFLLSPARAQNLSFQPRLEFGAMYYEFESAPLSVTVPPAGNLLQSGFEYSDCLLLVSSGGTFFLNRFFLDISGQYAFNGQDSASISDSYFMVKSIDEQNNFLNSEFFARQLETNARIDRHDIAVSLGYTITRRLSLFAGYKWAETQFKVTKEGPYSVNYYHADIPGDNADYVSGRSRGESISKFNYQGPFIGLTLGFDFSNARVLKGMLTANLALAALKGKVKNENRWENLSITWIDEQQIPEQEWPPPGETESSQYDTRGDTLGLTVGFGWRGSTPWEGLSYSVSLNTYRYEFDAQGTNNHDINETVVQGKLGLAYVF